MDKTTIYLPAELKEAVRRVAQGRGVMQSQVIRDAVRAALGDQRPHPRGGLFASGTPSARDADDHLRGIGSR